MDRWVRKIGDRVTLTKGHEDETWFEALRRIYELEEELEMQQMKYRNLERQYNIAKKWNEGMEARNNANSNKHS